MSSPADSYPIRVQSPSGLSMDVNANGSIRRIDHGDLIVNSFLGNEVEGGPANIFLRRRGASIDSTPLLGPLSPAGLHVDENGLTARGEWKGVRFTLSLILAEAAPAWFWHVALENLADSAQTVDLIYAQDLALSQYPAVRLNEYYVSQYVDYTPLTHAERGVVLAVRQNLAMDDRHPWGVIGCLGNGVSFATDALQLHGLATRAGRAPEALASARLPAKRRQHEHSMAVVQEAEVRLAPGASASRGFFGWLEADHPPATSAADLAFVDKALALPEAGAIEHRTVAITATESSATLFSARPILATLDLNDAEIDGLFGRDRRGVERDNGSLRSFFTGAHRHVVLKAKELGVLRPHGHILRTGDRLTPDEASLTSTTWMNGVFHSMLTQGHVSINRLLSTTRSYLSLLRSGGQRIFAELADGYHLLDVPSAYEITPNGCRWIYKHAGGLIQVRSRAPIDRHELGLSIEVLAGPSCRFLISNHVALNGDDGAEPVPVRFDRDGNAIVIRTIPGTELGERFPEGSFRVTPVGDTAIERVGGDELLFFDGGSRRAPFLVVVTARASSAEFRIEGELIPAADRAGSPGPVGTSPPIRSLERSEEEERFWRRMSGSLSLHAPANSPLAADVANLQEILPWLAHNAMIHYLAPRGLEQYSGGGWGTRDVCQGPVEMLLALGEWAAIRDLLIRVFQAQNADGDWPQWFTFFDRDRAVRAGDSHGDVVFWPLLALAEYLLATEDAAIADEVLPFFHDEGDEHAEKATVAAHVERALAVIAERRIPGTSLAAYGHGDWNDSLQPVDPAMRERLCSSWTVTLHFQTVTALAAAWRRIGRGERAAELEAMAPGIRADMQRLLIADDTLAGFAYFHPDQRIEYLLHPRDQNTGIHYRLLPMIHAIINGLLTPEQARTHVGTIKQHLLAPDGARLFDRPPRYQGGPQRYFQRAESSTFFGREIGIMYMHAHLRYAEAMARYGDADAFFLALRQANPIGLRSVVPMARPRQANCYYSSSDAAFDDRYEGLSRYDEVKKGKVALEGGWRIYSSGAGIWTRLIHQCFLGLRRGKSTLGIDPVIPKSLDGLRAEVELAGKKMSVLYRIGARGHGPSALTLNGTSLSFEREANPYRTGGAEVSMALVSSLLAAEGNELVVQLG